MGLGTTIKARVIALFDVQKYEQVSYTGNIPSVASPTPVLVSPKSVILNDTSATFKPDEGGGNKIALKDWQLELHLTFTDEVDFSDYLMTLQKKDFSFPYSDTIQVDVNVGNTINIQQPPRQGAGVGTDLRLNITVNTINSGR